MNNIDHAPIHLATLLVNLKMRNHRIHNAVLTPGVLPNLIWFPGLEIIFSTSVLKVKAWEKLFVFLV